MSLVADRDNERSSQTVKALVALRRLIIAGDLVPGERISELVIVERIGASRTPVRHALVKLEEEGFLEVLPSGGYAVKAFTERDVFDAIETRGVLEGLAARLAAERGVPPADLAPLKQCLDQLDTVLAPADVGPDGFSAYVRLNAAFHVGLAGLAGSKTLVRQIERAAALPFASPSGFVLAQSVMKRPERMLIIAQDHHRSIVEAIERREGERAEAITREHARLAARNLRRALNTEAIMDLVPGNALIRFDGRA